MPGQDIGVCYNVGVMDNPLNKNKRATVNVGAMGVHRSNYSDDHAIRPACRRLNPNNTPFPTTIICKVLFA